MKNYSDKNSEKEQNVKVVNILYRLLEKIVYLVLLIIFIKCLLSANV